MTPDPKNNLPRAVLIGFAMLALAVLLSNHWAIVRVGPMQAVLLNQWTGSFEPCALSETSSGVRMVCQQP